jgi:hypothetical protein
MNSSAAASYALTWLWGPVQRRARTRSLAGRRRSMSELLLLNHGETPYLVGDGEVVGVL